ncbi:hypothetical protein [Rhodococcus sp. HNM0569]|uniref:hypothetical protein n=1 Tax=Rhodococcus sp. HNM0569 TaxID=2716340 RepID=UPI00146B9002|nr:hypothetical protein [Rhodococcus sp. HNM0569]NLU83937.1 hypothetical protein [Rhodococcus sp. HNM0569]
MVDEQIGRRVPDGQIGAWCAGAWLPGAVEDLGDTSALVIASARLAPDLRAVVLRRIQTGRGFADVGGFGALRRLADERARFADRAETSGPPPVQAMYRFRANDLDRRIQAARAAFVAPGEHFGTGIRAIRRDRRDGVHLDPEQRGLVFDALVHTPTPADTARGTERLAQQLTRVADRVPGLAPIAERAQLVPKLTGVFGHLEPSRTREPEGRSHFADRYDTALFLAASVVDRIEATEAWHSEHFAVQRYQLDPWQELLQIAVDTTELRGVVGELGTLEERGAPVASRRRALDDVWKQLLARVAALVRVGDLLARADDALRATRAADRAAGLDARIDRLLSRSGNRELSVDNARHVGDQISSLDHVFLGYREELHRGIAELTSGR